jgi:hypothetical protein
MELNPPLEDTSHTATQELSCILWNLKVRYHVHKNPLLVPVLNQIDLVHTTPSYLRSILILFIYLHLGLPIGLFPSGFPTNIVYAFVFAPIHATCSAQFILFDLTILIILQEEYEL